MESFFGFFLFLVWSWTICESRMKEIRQFDSYFDFREYIFSIKTNWYCSRLWRSLFRWMWGYVRWKKNFKITNSTPIIMFATMSIVFHRFIHLAFIIRKMKRNSNIQVTTMSSDMVLHTRKMLNGTGWVVFCPFVKRSISPTKFMNIYEVMRVLAWPTNSQVTSFIDYNLILVGR